MRIFVASSPYSAFGGQTVASMPNALKALSGCFVVSVFFVMTALRCLLVEGRAHCGLTGFEKAGDKPGDEKNRCASGAYKRAELATPCLALLANPAPLPEPSRQARM
jgi:hypothetical protein